MTSLSHNKTATMLPQVCITIAASFFVLVIAPTSFAYAQSCNELDWGVGNEDRINYYLHTSIAARLSECTPDPNDDSELTNDHVGIVVQQAAEMWNMEAVGPLLVYAGTYNDSTPCSFVTAPAVLVEFRQSCKDLDGQPGCEESAFATFVSSGCGQVNRLIVWAHPDSTDCLDGQGNPKSDSYDWDLGDGSPSTASTDLLVNLAHEFGHALSIHHPDEPIAEEDRALVSQGAKRTQRHLYGYDQACADDFNGGRASEYHWKGIDDDGVFETNTSSNGLIMEKGMYSGGHFSWDNGTTERYAIHLDTEMRNEAVGTNGSFSFTLNSSTVDTNLKNRRTSPVGTTMLEFSAMAHKNRMLWAEDFFSDDTPDIWYSRDKALGDPFFSNVVDFQMHRCSDSGCSSTFLLQGHIPITMAWDEYSDTTVVARVRTSRSSTQGQVWIYPGFHGTSLYKLRKGTKLTGTGPTETFDTWDYSYKTDFPVGMACAPDRSDVDYNCLIAWQDRGIPDGSILYKYFRINPTTKAIEWRSGNTSKRAGSLSSSGVSAAYFDGSFWMTWKRAIVGGGDINHTRTTTSCDYTCWSSFTPHFRGDIADPPTWFYVPHQTHESTLIWSEPN